MAVWKKVDGGAEYVADSTYYICTDGTNYRCTISGLDPAAQYRVTISYDSSKYYLYGLLKVEGHWLMNTQTKKLSAFCCCAPLFGAQPLWPRAPVPAWEPIAF